MFGCRYRLQSIDINVVILPGLTHTYIVYIIFLFQFFLTVAWVVCIILCDFISVIWNDQTAIELNLLS